ncbi:MAG: YwiC-like family protein [Armatimonadota bacterium]
MWKYWRHSWPKEHGAWVILAVSFAIGAVSGAGNLSWQLVLLAAALLAFLGRADFAEWIRGKKPPKAFPWFLVDALGAAVLLVLLIVNGYRLLLPLAVVSGVALAVHTFAYAKRSSRKLWVEAIGVVGLAASAPAAWYVSTGELWPKGAALWALCALYFTGAVMHVEHLLAARSGRLRTAQLLRKLSVAYHLCAVVLAVAVAYTTGLPWLVSTAMVPAWIRAMHPKSSCQHGPLTRVGRAESLYAAIFASILIGVLIKG